MNFWDKVKAMRATGRPLTVAKAPEAVKEEAPKKKKTAKKAVSKNDSGTDTDA